MMKKQLLLLALSILSLQAFAQLTTKQWSEDLQFLKETIHLKYPNLFHNVSAEQFDAAVDALNKQLPKLKDYEVAAEMSKIVAMFRIGHTQLVLRPQHAHHGGEHPLSLAFGRIPVQFYWFSDGLYVRAADKKYENAIGGRVLQIGKMKTAEALEAIRPYTVYENEKGFEANAPFYLTIPALMSVAGINESLDQVPVVFEKNGKTEHILLVKSTDGQNSFGMTGLTLPPNWVEARNPDTTPLWQREPKAFRYMEYLKPQKTLYLRHSVTLADGDKTIAAFFKTALDFIDQNEVEKLVLDVRMNGGGNNTLNKPIITSIIAARKINQKGKFYCIIGRRTFSACQNLVNELEKYTEVTFVGEPTSENVNFFGDTRTETLPNSGLAMNLSWLWWQNHFATDKRPWMAPHIATDMTFADYVANRDPAMDFILTNSNPEALNDLEAIVNLAAKGDSKAALESAIQYKNAPRNRYYLDRFEDNINQSGYDFMQKSDFNAAYVLFDLNVQLFPDSANAYDSKAESLWKLGKKEEAIQCYEMAIKKDAPNGATAQNAQRMIKQIQGK